MRPSAWERLNETQTKGKENSSDFWKAGTDQIPTEFIQEKKRHYIAFWDQKLIHFMTKNIEIEMADKKLHIAYLQTLQ